MWFTKPDEKPSFIEMVDREKLKERDRRREQEDRQKYIYTALDILRDEIALGFDDDNDDRQQRCRQALEIIEMAIKKGET